jgi:mannose/cellobiose epimerase-like protein (N-acyl-D-glucosamine 2-epimerase family)
MSASIFSILVGNYAKAENLLKGNNLIRQNLYPDDTPLKFGDLSLKDLRNDYYNYLFEDFLPFMNKYVIDHKYGGFMCNTDRNGKNINTNKDTWTEGRGIWVYSFLYKNFGKDEKYLDVARNSLNLILKTKPQDDDLWPDKISREGNALTPSSKEILGDVLVAEGLSEYARASGEWKYWNMAKDIILKCWKIYNNPGYYPNIVEEYQGPKAFPFPGARIQGVSMLMIITINNMFESQKDPDLEKIISECTNAVVNKFFNPEFRLNNELLNHDYSRPNNELAQFVYTGISIESLWPIMERAIKLKDVKLFQTAAERFKRHIEVAWDNVYGGVFRSLNNVEKNLWEVERLAKVLWAQQEALNGIVILIEQTGDEWAKNWWFEKIYKYMVDKHLLKQYGYPLWITNGDRKVTFEPPPHYNSIENYHLPRHLMLTYLALDRIIENNGNPIWQAAVNQKDGK